MFYKAYFVYFRSIHSVYTDDHVDIDSNDEETKATTSKISSAGTLPHKGKSSSSTVRSTTVRRNFTKQK